MTTHQHRPAIAPISSTLRVTSPLIAISVAVALFGACSADDDRCEEKRSCGPDSDAEGGSAGADSGGRPGDGGGSVGGASGGDANGGGGGDAGATGLGGSAGAAGSGGAQGGASSGGAAGAPSGGSGVTAGVGGASDGEAGAGGEGGGVVLPYCGDGIVDDGEACDDGNDDLADGCRTNCTWGPKQVFAGHRQSCVVYGNGAAKCWGENTYGTLGQGDEVNRGDQPNQMGANLPFIMVANVVGNFTALAMHQQATCGVMNSKLYCWGRNQAGLLGIQDSRDRIVGTPQAVDVGGPVANVAVAFGFACALLVNGDVKCWGHGLYGHLGIGTEDDIGNGLNQMGANLKKIQFGEKATQIACGTDHTCALLQSGAVACWGKGGSALGHENSEHFGDHPDETPPPSTSLGLAAVATGIGVSDRNSCAIMSGLVKCWGDNSGGSLGLGHQLSLGNQPGEMGVSLPIVPVTTPVGQDLVVSLHLGSAHTCALLASGAAKCWGYRGHGRLAQPNVTALIGNIGDAELELGSIGGIDFGLGTTVRSLATGAAHTCALLSTGDVKCWGLNDAGQLGLGHTDYVGSVPGEVGEAMPAAQLD